MGSLVDDLIASAQKRVDAAQQRIENEASRLAQGLEDAQERSVGFAAHRSSVDEFVQDLKEGRLQRAADDAASRTESDATRRADTAEFMSNVSASIAGLKLDVGDMLGSFLGTRKANAEVDRAARDEVVQDRREAEDVRRAEGAEAAEARRDVAAQRTADVAEELGELAEERTQAKVIWREGVEAVRDIETGASAEKAAAAAEQAAKERADAERAAAEKAAKERAAAEKAAEKAAAENEKAAKRAASSEE
jgi:colicin import membrane protein